MPAFVAGWVAGAIYGAFGATTVAIGVVDAVATIAYAAAYVATLAALAYGESALAANASHRQDPGQLLDTAVVSDAPRQIIVGYRATGGSLVGQYVTGPGNNNLIQVIAIADHRCESCEGYYASGIRQLTNLVHGVRNVVSGYRDKDGDRMWVTWHDGRWNQTVDTDLISRTFTYQAPWTNHHYGKGVSYAVVEMEWDDDVMLQPVQSLFYMRGGRWYDRREDTTAGGSGAQRWLDPDTWIYTANPDVFGDHYQLGVVPYPNANIYSWGIGLRDWQLPYATFKDEADISDETVATKDGGHQARYEMNAVLSGVSTHREILDSVARTKAGRVIDRGGRLSIIGPQARTPVLTIYDEDLISGEQSKYSDKTSISGLYNVFRGTFPDPDQSFRPIEYPKVTNPDWVAEDGGDELPEDVDIDSDTDVERIQRLVTLHANDVRRQAVLVEAYKPFASELDNGDWFERVGAKFPDGKLFEVTRIEYMATIKKGAFVYISSKEVDPSDVAWSADQAVALSRPPPPAQETAFVLMPAPSLMLAPDTITGDGVTVIPAMTLSWSNSDDDPRVRGIEISYTQVDDTNSPIGVLNQAVAPAGAGQANTVKIPMMAPPAAKFAVQARYTGLITPGPYSSTQYIVLGPDFSVPTAGGAIPGSDLDVLLNKDPVFLPFAIVGAVGSLQFDANVDAASSVTVEAGYIDDPVTKVRIDTVETWFRTPWGGSGASFAPANGWFGIAYSVEDTATRFANKAGSGHFFPFTIKDGVCYAWKYDFHAGEEFTPELTDIVVARADKALAPGSDILSSVDGITNIEGFVRDTNVVNARLETIDATIGDPGDAPDGAGSIYARYSHLSVAQAAETAARVSDISTLTANLATANANITTNATAAATNAAAIASLSSSVTASFATTNANVATNVTAIASEASTRASQTSTLTANLGTTNATVSTQGTALTSLQGASAIYDILVAATGGDPAIVRLLSGLGGSEISLAARILRLINTTTGGTFEVMRAVGGLAYFSAPITVDIGTARMTLGPGFGVSGQECFIWVGSTSVAVSSMSRANASFALGSDKLPYYGGSVLASNALRATFSPDPVNSGSIGAGARSRTTTITVSGGSGSYSYAWSILEQSSAGGTGTAVAAIGTNRSTISITVSTTVTVGQSCSGHLQCIVTDTTSGVTAPFVVSFDLSETS